LAACAGGPPARGDLTLVYDSAGVQIVESTAPLWRDGISWSVAAHPELRIGVLDGPEHYQFTDIAASWRRDDGRIVVGERMALQVRIFAPDGSFLHAFGGAGEGPGEFRHLTALAPYRGDSIVAWDTRLKRLITFDLDGAHGRTERISLPQVQQGAGERSFGISEGFWGAFDDGSHAFVPMELRRYNLNDLLTFRRPLVRLSPGGDSLNALGALDVVELRGIDRPFARVPLVALAGEHVYAGVDYGGEGASGSGGGGCTGSAIGIWSMAGNLERLIRPLAPCPTVSARDRQSFGAWYRERERIFQTPEPEVERRLATIVFPAELPPYSALVVDALGYIWAEEYRLGTDPSPATWRVFDANGHWLGRVELPAGLRVHQIGADFVLGVRRDEVHEVPVVESYSLRRTISS
jgi:hypothetical protein